jgi:transcriptional regulator with XRE-family HTH domain
MINGRSFGAYLKHQRELRGVTLDHVCNLTKISRSLLQALENDDVSKWPAGIFRRAFFRSYASAVGFDPAPLEDDFSRLFVSANEKMRARFAIADLHRAYPTALRLTLAADDAAFSLKKQHVAPALLDAFLVAGLVLAITSVGQAYLALGLAAAASYHAVPRALGWATIGGFLCRFVADHITRSKAPGLRERFELRKKRASSPLDSRRIIRSVDGTQSRRAG